jgi:hypothetical protein
MVATALTLSIGEGRSVPIPERVIILLSGMPATGKSSFARYLAHEHGFTHYDMERHPRGWPLPELKGTWEKDRALFVPEIRKHHHRTALDWGFPVRCQPIVEQFREQGVRLVWFDGDVESARKLYIERAKKEYAHEDAATFDRQVKEIEREGYPGALNCLVVRVLSAGAFLSHQMIDNIIFQ